MCTFVLGTLPANAPLDRQERGFFRFWKVKGGSSIASVLQPGELLGRMTTRYCDCGTGLGSAPSMERTSARKRQSIEHNLDRLRRKRKGWSHTKVERWQAQVEADRDRHAKVKAKEAANETREWRDWLHHALEEIRVDHVGLLVDDFDGQFDDAYRADKKPLPSARDVRLSEVDERFLMNMDRGILYRVRR